MLVLCVQLTWLSMMFSSTACRMELNVMEMTDAPGPALLSAVVPAVVAVHVKCCSTAKA